MWYMEWIADSCWFKLTGLKFVWVVLSFCIDSIISIIGLWSISNCQKSAQYFVMPRRTSLLSCAALVFVKDAALYFTNRDHEHGRREIVITIAKHEAEWSHYCKWGRHIQNLIPNLDKRLVLLTSLTQCNG